MNGNEIDMRMFAQRAGASVTYATGSIVFNKNDPGSCMYIVQSGVIEMLIGDTVIETCGPNEAIGFMSKIDRTRQGGMRTVTHRSAQIPLHGRRGTELRALHHGRHGATHPRHESGNVTVETWHIAGGLCQEGIPHRPLVPATAGRAKDTHALLADAQQGSDLALDAAVDFSSGRRANEDEVFHNRLPRRR